MARRVKSPKVDRGYLVREVSLRHEGGPVEMGDSVTNPGTFARLCREAYPGETRERFVALALDARHRPLGFYTVSIGTLNASLVHPREVFRPAVAMGAASILVAHNHPSGDFTPSPEDREVTRRLAKAGEIMGIKVLDSVVWVDGGGWASLRESDPHLLNVEGW